MRWRDPLRASLLVAGAAIFISCAGSSADDGSNTTRVSFQIFRSGMNRPCAEVGGIEEIEVTLLTPNGLTPVAGFPRKVECALGAFDITGVPRGDYVLDVAARGALGQDRRSVLFRARTNVSLPMDGIELSLRPEVAYLSVGWVFEDSELTPCIDDVNEVEVLISTGTAGVESFSRRYRCTETPVAIPVPFPLLTFTIQVNAYSDLGFVLFSETTMRALERGDNTFTATLSPLGGRLFLDWLFAIRAQTFRDCMDPRIRVAAIVATVRSLEGAPPVSETIPCTVSRPHAFRGQRFSPGRRIELELVAEGESERFRGVEELVMPEGDRLFEPPLLLDAVGTATVAFSVGTSTCARAPYDGFDIRLAADDEGGTPKEVRRYLLGPAAMSQRVEDLPYGTYSVTVSQVRNAQATCTVTQARSINGRSNAWSPFVL